MKSLLLLLGVHSSKTTMYFVVLVVVSATVNVQASTLRTTLPDVVTDGTITNHVTDTMATKTQTVPVVAIGTVPQVGINAVTMDATDSQVVTTEMVSKTTMTNIEETTPNIEPMSTTSTDGTTLPDQTTQTPPEVVTTTCTGGFVQCRNGGCEPFASLCGDEGIVTIATEVPVTIETVPVTFPMSTGEHTTVAGSTEEMVTQTTTHSPDIFSGMTDITMTTDSVANMVTDGECHLGFVKCVDGRCEPYEHLCGDAGFITLPTASTISTTTAVSSVVTDIAGVSTVSGVSTSIGVSTASGISTTTGAPASTIPTTIATLPPLDNGCPPGLEKCSDGTCEPFHFMCDEHLSSTLIGR